jgi:hypothetical protein
MYLIVLAVELPMGTLIGLTAASEYHLLPSLSPWVFGLIIGGVMCCFTAVFTARMQPKMWARWSPTRIVIGADGLRAELPPVSGSNPPVPRRVVIPWAEVVEIKSNRSGAFVLRYSRGGSAASPPSAAVADIVALTPENARRIEVSWGAWKERQGGNDKGPLPEN